MADQFKQFMAYMDMIRDPEALAKAAVEHNERLNAAQEAEAKARKVLSEANADLAKNLATLKAVLDESDELKRQRTDHEVAQETALEATEEKLAEITLAQEKLDAGKLELASLKRREALVANREGAINAKEKAAEAVRLKAGKLKAKFESKLADMAALGTTE